MRLNAISARSVCQTATTSPVYRFFHLILSGTMRRHGRRVAHCDGRDGGRCVTPKRREAIGVDPTDWVVVDDSPYDLGRAGGNGDDQLHRCQMVFRRRAVPGLPEALLPTTLTPRSGLAPLAHQRADRSEYVDRPPGPFGASGVLRGNSGAPTHERARGTDTDDAASGTTMSSRYRSIQPGDG